MPLQVLGVDLLRTKDVRSTHRLVVDHIAGVRKIPDWRRPPSCCSLRAIWHSSASTSLHTLQERDVKKWVCLSEGQGGTIGWLTTNERKEAMCFQFRDALRVGNIFLSKHLFSVLLEPHEIVKTIRDELCRFAIVTEPAKTLFGKVRKTYTGKLGVTRRSCDLSTACHHRTSLLLPVGEVCDLPS